MAWPSVDHEGPGLKCQKLEFDGTAPLQGKCQAAAEKADLDFKKFGFRA